MTALSYIHGRKKRHFPATINGIGLGRREITELTDVRIQDSDPHGFGPIVSFAVLSQYSHHCMAPVAVQKRPIVGKFIDDE